jgi:hypothetical protein
MPLEIVALLAMSIQISCQKKIWQFPRATGWLWIWLMEAIEISEEDTRSTVAP